MRLQSIVLLILSFVAASSQRDVSSPAICPPIPGTGLEHGRFTRINLNEIRVNCDRGYLLVGAKRIRCLNGKWNAPLKFECRRPVNECPLLKDIPNGKLWSDERRVGVTVLYSCNPGFTMDGHNKRHCTRNRYWNGVEPTCIANLSPPEKISELLINQMKIRDNPDADNSGLTGRILDAEIYKVGLDLVFLLDRSSSIDPVDLRHAMDFIKFLIGTFGINNSLMNQTRVAVISFADKAELVFNLNNKEITSLEKASKLIDNIKDEGGGTAMEPAFAMVFSEIIEHLRTEPNARRAVFLMTDGEPNIGSTAPEATADLLKKDLDFEIFSVGVGKGINRHRLFKIASEPVSSHVFFLEKFGDFRRILEGVTTHPVTTPKPPPPGPESCGLLAPETSDEVDVPYPWLATILVYPEKSAPKFCTGVLICGQWVLTSAICVTENNTRVVQGSRVAVTLGERNLTNFNETQTTYYVTTISMSPQQDDNQKLEHRLALLKLHVKPPLNYTYRPICLPLKRGGIQIPLHTNTYLEAYLEGFGASSSPFNTTLAIDGNNVSPNFRRIRATYLNEPTCTSHVNRTMNRTLTRESAETFMCTGTRNPREDWACSGNYGSPLVAREPNSGRYHLIGIQGSQSGCTNRYTIFVVVAHYIEWLSLTTSKCWKNHDFFDEN